MQPIEILGTKYYLAEDADAAIESEQAWAHEYFRLWQEQELRAARLAVIADALACEISAIDSQHPAPIFAYDAWWRTI